MLVSDVELWEKREERLKRTNDANGQAKMAGQGNSKEDWIAKKTDWVQVKSSIIQGSVLGGILFNIFIDDIDQEAGEVTIMKFADNTKLANVMRNEVDAKWLQVTFDNLNGSMGKRYLDPIPQTRATKSDLQLTLQTATCNGQ